MKLGVLAALVLLVTGCSLQESTCDETGAWHDAGLVELPEHLPCDRFCRDDSGCAEGWVCVELKGFNHCAKEVE